MKSNSTICFAALAASLLFLAFSANGQDIRIHGKVIDAATLLPVQQASVFLAHLPVRAVSDSAGTFILTNVPEGEFELRVTKPGYLPYRRFAKSGDGTYQILIKLNADTLSTTHEPGRQVSTLQSLREKIYVCTDKPYYYPGEIIWFAGYFSYFDRTKKDSLSRVAYVDVIGPDRNIIAKKMIPVDNGMINGHIQLPQDLRRGQYLMRSYTTWMLNFADEDIFYKPVPVLDLFESVDRDALTSRKRAAKTADGSKEKIKLEADKSVYRRRERINLFLSFADSGWAKSGFFSLSVTDEKQVVPIAENNILQQSGFMGERSSSGNRISSEPVVQFPIESGISFMGQFKKGLAKPKKVTLSLVVNEFEDFFIVETDETGKFFLNGLHFYDSAIFYYWAHDLKKKVPGKLEIATPPDPVAPLLFSGFWFKTNKEKSVQRSIDNSLLPDDATLLREVVIQGRKEDASSRGENGRLGNPDYVLEGNQLSVGGPNLLMSLQGRVPGLIITCFGVNCSVRFNRQLSVSPVYTEGPLILVDGMPVSGEASDILQSINPFDVRKVEVKRRNSYSSDRGNGIIAVYTKQGPSDDGDLEKSNQFFSLKGYAREPAFTGPDHSETTHVIGSDYRSTLYWNPGVEINERQATAHISFFAADLSTRYRIVVEGITSDAEPVRVEKYITIQ